MKFDNSGIFESSDINRALGAATGNAMAFNPFIAWGAGIAVGMGTLAGIGRAMAERADFAPVSVSALAAWPAAGPVRWSRTESSPKPAAVMDAPVEVLSRPILSGMIEQAIVEDEARSAPKPAAKAKAGKGPARPAGLEKPRAGKADDLKRISGIGPKLELTLNDLGIYHFDQIASWAKQEIDWIDDYLSFKGRVERDRWIEQAAELAV